ncbi:MAG: MFS transporter [Paracoccaceae bacterium]|jgi:MFS transporter, DHA1 family, inner membrane transport protein|nr:MFS transporter [Paracoccaceae bacterium]MDG1371453.1 MFS transporter [Paracoccaceae bacterium]MDG1971665.1 MFS transporter [Paracoccaceae bacterium]
MGRAWPILILLGFCQFCASWGSLAIIAVQVEMRSGLNVSTDDIAALIWAFSFSLAIGAPLAQAIIGHWDRRAVLFASLTMLGFGAIALGFAQGWEQAMAARVVMALGAASVMPTASVIAASVVTPEQRPAAMSVVFGGLTASLVIALPISSAVAEALGWRAAWFVAGGAAFTAALGVVLGVPGGVRGTRASLGAMLSVLSSRATGLTIMTTLLLICGGFITYSMMAFWFVEVGEAPRSALTFALLLGGIASVGGNAASSFIVTALGREGTILGGLAFTALCFLILYATPHVYLLSYPAFICFGVGWSMCLAPLQARLMETAGERAQLALALNASAFFGGQGLGAFGGGAVYEAFGPVMLPLASVCVLCGATGLFFVSRRG